MEFRWHELGADRHTICASRSCCGPNDLRFCHSRSSALRRVRRDQLPWRYMALGWLDVTVDAGDTQASSYGCYRSDVVPIRMAVPIFLAGSTVNSISLPCGNGTAPIGRSYFHRLFRLLGLPRQSQRILPRDRLLCLAVSLMLTRITRGPTMARHGLCNLQPCNLS